MSDRVFLDTNVFVYAAGGDGGAKTKIADTLITNALSRGNGAISYQVVQEFLNVALKKFATPFTIDQAHRFLNITFRPMFAVQASLGLYSDALDLHSRYRMSWYDSLIVAAASEANCSILYSEDMKHGSRFRDIRVENPFRSNER